jgi:hypothetical protein
MAVLKAPKNSQSHITFLALQVPLSLMIIQTVFHCLCIMKWNYDTQIHHELRQLNALWISAIMQVFGCDHRKGHILLQLQWKSWALMYEIELFTSLTWIFILFSLFCPISQQSWISEECSKDVQLTSTKKANFDY